MRAKIIIVVFSLITALAVGYGIYAKGQQDYHDLVARQVEEETIRYMNSEQFSNDLQDNLNSGTLTRSVLDSFSDEDKKEIAGNVADDLESALRSGSGEYDIAWLTSYIDEEVKNRIEFALQNDDIARGTADDIVKNSFRPLSDKERQEIITEVTNRMGSKIDERVASSLQSKLGDLRVANTMSESEIKAKITQEVQSAVNARGGFGIKGEKGDDGDDGDDGKDGKDADENAIIRQISNKIESGAITVTSTSGGASAYDMAKQGGYTGTSTEFCTALANAVVSGSGNGEVTRSNLSTIVAGDTAVKAAIVDIINDTVSNTGEDIRVGTLSDLATTQKTNLVAAVNEVNTKAGNAKTQADTAKTKADTLDSKIGNLSSLNSSFTSGTVVGALNEVMTRTDTTAITGDITTIQGSIQALEGNVTDIFDAMGNPNNLETTNKDTFVGAINEANALAKIANKHVKVVNDGTESASNKITATYTPASGSQPDTLTLTFE